MNDRTVRLRVVWLSLAALLALAAFNATLHPLVKGFGLAHARWLDSEFRPVFVVDNLSRDEVGTILEMYPAEVRGQRAFRVYEILLPTVILAAAMSVLAHFLALHFRSATGWLWSRRPRIALPPMALWSGLMLGCLTGLSLASDWRFPREAALMPFVLAILGTASVSLRAWPDAGRLCSALTGLSAARWFWLGFLATAYAGDVTAHSGSTTLRGSLSWAGGITPQGTVSWDAPPSAAAWQMSPGLVAGLVVAFLLFHWFTRTPRKVGLSMVSGDWRGLVDTCDRLTQVAIGELWVLLPLVLWTASHFPNRSALGLLTEYLLASAACSAMARWTLEGHPPQPRSWRGRLGATLWRAGTVALIFALPLLVVGQAAYDGVSMPIAVPFVLIGLGLVGGQPWRAQKKACDFAVRTAIVQPASSIAPRRPSSWRKRRAALAAAVALGVAVISGAHEDWSARQPQAPSAEQRIGDEFAHAFGHRARYLRNGNQSLVIGQELSGYERARAELIVRSVLPNDRVYSTSVYLWRWEAVGLGILILTLAGVLVTLPTLLLGLLGQRSLTAPFVVLAGANGAFALGAKWGWFWLDPYLHLAAFGVAAATAGFGVSSAKRCQAVAEMAAPIPAERPEVQAPTVQAEPQPKSAGDPDPAPAPVAKVPSVVTLMKIDALSIEVGRGLAELVDQRKGAKLLERVTSIRRHVAMELGIVVPGICFRDNLQLHPKTYILKVREIEVAQGRVEMGCFLAIGPEDTLTKLPGERTVDPTFGMPGVWIQPQFRKEAERYGCMIFDPVSVIATQITEVIRSRAPELMTLEQVHNLVGHYAEDCPVTVQMLKECHSLLTLRDVYRGLLTERVSIRDHEAIFNALIGAEGSTDALITEVRLALREAISREYCNHEKTINVIGLDAVLEKELLGCLRGGELPEGSLQRYGPRIVSATDALAEKGFQPIVLAHPRLRHPLRRLMKDHVPSLVVLATSEIAPGFRANVVHVLSAPAPSEVKE